VELQQDRGDVRPAGSLQRLLRRRVGQCPGVGGVARTAGLGARDRKETEIAGPAPAIAAAVRRRVPPMSGHHLVVAAPFCVWARAAEPDVILKAMRAEVERAKTLKFDSLESPYYVEANVDDVIGFSTSATLGGLVSANHLHFRSPRVAIRVGSYNFDNTNY